MERRLISFKVRWPFWEGGGGATVLFPHKDLPCSISLAFGPCPDRVKSYPSPFSFAPSLDLIHPAPLPESGELGEGMLRNSPPLKNVFAPDEKREIVRLADKIQKDGNYTPCSAALILMGGRGR